MKRYGVLVIPVVLMIALAGGGCDLFRHYSDEGSVSNPVTIQINVTHRGTIGEFGTSYYKFVAAANGVHTIALTDLGSDFTWDL